MFKRLWSRFGGERAVHKATVRIDFFPQDLAVPRIFWHQSREPAQDTVALGLFFYARILYELAELNETRTAKELMCFLDKVRGLVLAQEGEVKRPRLPLGAVRLGEAPGQEPPLRQYRAEFYQGQDGGFRLDFQGSIGKEGFYLPAAFLVFLQTCINDLPEEDLKQLLTGVGRLHTYYRYRKDFWDGTAITAGPAFALSREEIAPKETASESKTPQPEEE
ncbi:MAG: hypothetical protein JRI59_02145 [Deltaproteobacteria bacterium]|nr:hypothetical protein [Deltaproteobacteria bacterium]